MYKQEYHRLCRDPYKDHIKIFTDGSKQEKGAGAAIFCNGSKTHATLSHEATIFSAEAHAISMAIRRTDEIGNAKTVIMSDSYRVLQALTNVHTSHPVIRKLIDEVDDIKREGRDVEFCWIPSHVGIEGNEKADEAAAQRQEEYIPVHYKDRYSIIKAKIEEDWDEQWKAKNQKMYAAKKKNGPWERIKGITRKEVVINRLRAGYCNFSHGYLTSRYAENAMTLSYQ